MFEDKVAVITGSARGIGRATAEILASQGAKVVIADLDREEAEKTAAEIDGETQVWAGNLTADGAAESLIATAIDNWGQLDIVVNNAGYTLDAPIHKMDDADFQSMLDIHTIVPFRVLRAAAPHLREPAKRERSEGVERIRKVVNISSAAAWGNPGQVNYSSAKAGVVGLTKTLAREWGPLKICVNSVAFGFIDTRLTVNKTADTTIEVEGRKIPVGVPAESRAVLDAMVPLGRSGSTAEAAGGIAFLCSPWSDYVTGQVLNVTGGLTLGMSS